MNGSTSYTIQLSNLYDDEIRKLFGLAPYDMKEEHLEIKLNPIILELISDALNSAINNWKHVGTRYITYLCYERKCFTLFITDRGSLIFTGPNTKLIEPEFDIEANEENLLAFLEWLDKGGKFPFLSSKEILTQATKTNKVHGVPHNTLTRKNNKRR